MNTMKEIICTGLRIRNRIFIAVFPCLVVLAAGCSKPSSSVDISGNWIEPFDLDNNSYTTWSFKPDGTHSATLTMLGRGQDPEAGTYKIRPTHGKIPGDIIECSFPKRDTPTLFRIPPNASTMIVRVDADDDAFSADRPDRRVTKAQAGQTGPSEAQRRSVEGVNAEGTYTGTVTSVEKTGKGGFLLRMDNKVYGKSFRCMIMDMDVSKFGDVNNLTGKKVTVTGKLEEWERGVMLFLEDADQLKVLE